MSNYTLHVHQSISSHEVMAPLLYYIQKPLPHYTIMHKQYSPHAHHQLAQYWILSSITKPNSPYTNCWIT